MFTTRAHQNFRLAAALFFALGLPLGAAAESEPGVSSDAILVGRTTSLTGIAAPLALQTNRGAKLYFDKLNAAGGVHERKIREVELDDAYNPAKAVANVKQLAEQSKVFCLFGDYGATTTKAILPLLDKFDLPLIAPVASTEELRDPVVKNVFLVRPSSHVEMKALIAHATTKSGLSRVAIVYQSDTLGTSMRLGAINALHAGNFKTVFEEMIPKGQENFGAIVEKLRQAKPDSVLLAMQYKSAAAFIAQAVEKNLDVTFLGNTILVANDFISSLAAALEASKPGSSKSSGSIKLLASAVVPPLDAGADLPIVRQYITDAKAAGLTPDDKELEGYLDAAVFTEALKRAGRNLTRAGFRKTLESMTDFDAGGIHVSYSPTSHRGSSKVFVLKLKGSTFVTASP